jgi:oxygen-independent coproporphyrinogen-3 oxidase
VNRSEAFLRGLEKEMALVDAAAMVFDTIYLGGGTPSVLDASQVHRIIEAAQGRFAFTGKPEITIEANPGTLSPHGLKSWLAWGVNRVNLGVQSFRDEHLGFLGRIHSSEEARQAIRTTREAGVVNLGLDLIYGLPNQTAEEWLEDLKEATRHRPEHLACYMLTYEKGTPLETWCRQGRFKPLPDDTVRDFFDVTVEYLEAMGYEQYEISNFSREKAFRSKHNQKYWNHTSYMGFGPSAHSFLESRRSWNHADLDAYLRALETGILPVQDAELLDRHQLMLETVFLGLRTAQGIDADLFRGRYGVDFMERFQPVLNTLKKRGLYRLVSLSSHGCRLTRQGRAFADTIAGVFGEHLGV